MTPLTADPELIAYCGLYCGACPRFVGHHCPGCRENDKAGWCKVRSCCLALRHASCADCTLHADPMHCGRFNNLASRLFGFMFHSNRAACVQRLRAIGAEPFAREMAAHRRHTLPS